MNSLLQEVAQAAAEEYKAEVSRRCAAGRACKAENGGYAYGSPAFGFTAEARSLVPDEKEQGAIHRIQELRRAGASTRTIAATLEREGHKPKRGDVWHSMTVSRILRRSSRHE